MAADSPGNSRTGNHRGLVNVLVARFSAFGDVAMTVPVLYSVCRCYPDVRFVFVTRPSMIGIFVNPPANLVLVGADVRDTYKGVAGLRRLVATLIRDYEIDAFVDLHNVLRTRVMSFFARLSGIHTYRIVKPRSKRRALTRRRNKVMLPLTSQRARYREAFFHAGLPVSDRFAGLYDGHGAAPAALFSAIADASARPCGERWIGIAPFAAHKGKIYPPELMEQVVARLTASETPVRVFLFGGGAAEKEILDGWAGRYDNVVSLAGKKAGFAVELALINHLDVMLSMDSANMHLAAIAGTPTVSVWGATHPYCGFRGWRQSDSDCIQLPLSCRPCSVFGNKLCYRGDYLCLNAIKPELVVNKLMSIISEK